MSIHKDLLPLRRAAIRVRPAQFASRSAAGGLLLNGMADPENAPRLITATWTNTAGALADVVWRHYREHSAGPFTVTLPNSGEVVHVIYSAPPQIGWESETTAASVVVELEETLAHE